MSALRPRRLVTAGGLAVTLALGAPVAAFAAPEEERAQDRGSSSASSDDRSRRPSSPPSAEPNRPGARSQHPGSSAGAGNERGASSNRPGRSEQARNGTPGRSEQAGSPGRSEQAGSAGRSDEGRAAGGDPRGNNGTIKIDGEVFDDGRGTEPHVGCIFAVDFYGFDAGDTATITFTGIAPTGGGVLHTESTTPISNDAAGGGQDRDATLTYSLAGQLSELLSVAPNPQQGWHVRVAVDVDSAPGGAKSKVFWISCDTPAVAGAATDAPVTGSAGAPGTTLEQRLAEPLDETPVLAAGTVHAAGFGGTTLVGIGGQAGRVASGAAAGPSTTSGGRAGDGAATLSARGQRLPSALPFTGAEALLTLLALGLAAVGVGAAAHRLGRRSSAPTA